MYKTVKEVCELTGLNRKLLHDYDEQNIVKPSNYRTRGYEDSNGKSYDGYKQYDEAAVMKLQQIAIFKKLGLERKEIKKKITASDYNSIKVLDEQIEMLKAKKEEIENLILLAEQLKYLGFKSEYSQVLAKTELSEVATNVKEWQSSPYYEDLVNMVSKVELSNDFDRKLIHIFKKLVASSSKELEGEVTKKILMELFKFLTKELGAGGLFTLLGIGMSGSDGALGQELDKYFSESQINNISALVMGYFEEFGDAVLDACVDVVMDYTDVIGQNYSNDRVKEMVEKIDVVVVDYLGFKHNFEYQMLFDFLGVEPYKEGDNALDYVYNADVKILYNIALEDEDVQTEYDAIAITPYGLFVIEVKNWGEKMHIDEKGVLSREDQDITYDLADRMNIKEAMLKGCLGNLFPSKYQGFLLFPSGNVQIDDSYKKLVICSGAGIVDEIRVMKEFGDCLPKEQIEEIVKVLEANHSEQRSICTVKCEEIIHDYAIIMTQIEEMADAKNQESEQHTEKVEAIFSSTYSKNEKEDAKQIEIPYFLSKDAKFHADCYTAACVVTGLALVTGLGMLVKKTLSK